MQDVKQMTLSNRSILFESASAQETRVVNRRSIKNIKSLFTHHLPAEAKMFDSAPEIGVSRGIKPSD
jgi:hypothetical protein